LPVAVIEGIWIGSTAVLLLYVFIYSVMAAISSKKFHWIITGLVFLFLIGLNYAFSEAENAKAQQMVIYKIYKHSAIDFFDGKKVYSVTDLNMEEKSLGYATEGHRYAMGVESSQQFYFEDTVSYVFNNLFYKNGFVQFYNIKMAIIDNSKNNYEGVKIKIDYILVRNSPKITIDELVNIFEFKKIIFDNSNKKWQIEKWRKQCEILSIDYYDMASEGAFILDLNKM